MRHLLTVILLLVLSGIKTRHVLAQDGYLTEIAWNKEGTRVAVGDSIGQIHFYDQSGQPLKTIKVLEDSLIPLVWYEDDTRSWLTVGDYGHPKIYIYDVEQDAVIQEFTHSSSTIITDLMWIKDASQLVSTSIDGDASPATIIWDVKTGNQLASNTYGDISGLSWDAKNHLIARAGISAVWLHDDVSLDRLTTIEWPEKKEERSGFYPTRIAWHQSSEWLAVGYMNGAVGLWSESKGLSFLSDGFDMTSEYSTRILAISFSPDGNRLTTVRSNGEVMVWDWRVKKSVTHFNLPNTSNFYYVALSSDASHVAFVDEDTNQINISKISTPEQK